MGKMAMIFAALLALAHFAFGQQTTVTSSTPTASTTSAAATFTISVGNNNQFQPDVVQTNIGDIIEFDFMPTNHSVVRAEYKFPCIPYEKTGSGKVGFFSGFHPVDAILANPPKWTLRINDSLPVFLYCSAPGACIKFGMVAVINPNSSVSLATQKQMAMDSTYMLQPGEDFPSESGTTSSAAQSSTSTSTSSSTSTSATPTVASASATPTSSSHKNGLGAGAIAGIAIGGICVIALAAALFFFIGRTKTLQESVNRQSEIPKTDMQQFNGSGPHGYYPVNPPDFQRHSQISAGYDAGVPPYGSPNSSQYPKPGQPGWVSPTRGGGSPPPQQLPAQSHPQPQFYGAAVPASTQQQQGGQQTQAGHPGGMDESPLSQHPIIGIGEKSRGTPDLVHEMYAPPPKDGPGPGGEV